jgi:hypothetical protein
MVNIANAQLARAASKAVMDYRNDPSAWMADYLFPRVPVDTITGKLPRFTSTNQKDIDDAPGPYGPAPRIEYDLGSTDYECIEHKRRFFMPDIIYKALNDAGETGRMLQNVSQQAILTDEALRIRRERAIATLLVDTSDGVTAQSTPSTKWDVSGGNPAETVATAIGTIDDAINKMPQYGLCTRDVALFLRRHVASLRASARGVEMADMSEVAAYLGLKEIRMINAGYDSGSVGAGRTGAKVITGNKFWVFYKPENISMWAPTWACTPTLRNFEAVKVFDDNSTVVGRAAEVYDWRDEVVVDTTACIYIPTPLTS